MKLQIGIIATLVTSLLISCYPIGRQMSYSPLAQQQIQFKGKYSEFIDPSETVLEEWYHYVISQDADGRYVERRFFPETYTLTSEIRYRDKNLDITDGLATYYSDDGVMSRQGNYIGDEEDGSWSYYHRSTGELSQIGDYEKGDKVGTWKNYDDQGRIISENYYVSNKREGKFITYDSLNNVTNEGIYKADTIFQQTNNPIPKTRSETFKVVEEMPRFYNSECESLSTTMEKNSCAQGQMLQYIYKSLKYPADAREYGIEGITITQFVVDTTGAITEVETLKGICQSIKDGSESVVRSMPKWIPGMQRGKKVNVLYTLPIRYKLEG